MKLAKRAHASHIETDPSCQPPPTHITWDAEIELTRGCVRRCQVDAEIRTAGLITEPNGGVSESWNGRGLTGTATTDQNSHSEHSNPKDSNTTLA